MDGNEHSKQHGEFKKAIEIIEGNVNKLWEKWNSMQKMLIATLTGVIINLGLLIFKLF